MTDKHGLDGVEFEAVRKRVDGQFLTLVAELDTAYYRYWKNGLSFDFYGVDPIKGKADAKATFDKLHGDIWRRHAVALATENAAMGYPYERDRLDPIDQATGRRRSEILSDSIAADKGGLPPAAREMLQ